MLTNSGREGWEGREGREGREPAPLAALARHVDLQVVPPAVRPALARAFTKAYRCWLGEGHVDQRPVGPAVCATGTCSHGRALSWADAVGWFPLITAM
ncbi:hypothetical protein SAMN05216499_1387 [Actinacidiphila paucisporea]|uniref:Uncharacterized protein n=1 Tax=Actinacidiphila paucisporea TaxID=310782 RepID=A0A1M7QMN9_9ACTN|nr:hypothetical protein SAMN05216499_1387 [Actinacidiphila paucisporea]